MINFNHTSTNYVFASAISGNGTDNVLAGTITYTGKYTRDWRPQTTERREPERARDNGKLLCSSCHLAATSMGVARSNKPDMADAW